MKLPIMYEKTDTPSIRTNEMMNFSWMLFGAKSPKPIVDKVVKA